MDLFNIRFLSDQEAVSPVGAAYGEIRIGSFRERFLSDLSFWNKAEYERQWRLAASRIVESDRAAMITSLGDPSSANFIRWWVMYREGGTIVLQEQILFLDELAIPFDPETAEKFVRDRESISEDGQSISEWSTSVQAMRSLLTL